MASPKKNKTPVNIWECLASPHPVQPPEEDSLAAPTTNRSKKGALSPLTVSMIPFGSWKKNVRAVVAKDVWDSMRYYFQATKNRPGFMRRLDMVRPRWDAVISCRCCGDIRDSLELHEVWEYDDRRKIQRLANLIPICDRCHNVIHYGRASQLGLADEALAHLQKVSRLTRVQAERHISDAYAIWTERSSHRYEVDMTYLRSFLPESYIHLSWLEKPKFWSGNRLDAIEWAKFHLREKSAIILDTETTGLISGPNKNPRAEVIELAIISMAGKLLYHSRFRPKYGVPKRTTDIHGIADADLANCPTFSQEHAKIAAILSGKTVITYNDKFDSGVIDQTCAMFKLASPDCQWDCAMRMYRAFTESAKFVKLPGATHGALADCKATLSVIKQMAGVSSVKKTTIRRALRNA